MSVSMAQPMAVPATSSTRYIQTSAGTHRNDVDFEPQYVWTLFSRPSNTATARLCLRFRSPSRS